MSKVPINYMIYTNVVFGARLYKDAQEEKKRKLILQTCPLKHASSSYNPTVSK